MLEWECYCTLLSSGIDLAYLLGFPSFCHITDEKRVSVLWCVIMSGRHHHPFPSHFYHFLCPPSVDLVSLLLSWLWSNSTGVSKWWSNCEPRFAGICKSKHKIQPCMHVCLHGFLQTLVHSNYVLDVQYHLLYCTTFQGNVVGKAKKL